MDEIGKPEAGGKPTNLNSRNRVGALDGLRGIAALIVVIYHLSLLYHWNRPLDHFGIKLVIAGPGAVLLFFVLSGYVLTATYIKKDRSYTAFAVKRAIRIYLPFAAAVVFAAVLSASIGQIPLPDASSWFNTEGWHSPVTATLLWSHLNMGSAIELDNVIWSLFHELRISIIIPVIAILIFSSPKRLIISSAVLAICAGLLAKKFVGWLYLSSVLTSVEYIPLFVAGGMVFKHQNGIVSYLERLPSSARLALCIAGLVMITYSPIGARPVTDPVEAAKLLVCGSGAAIIMSLSLTEGFFSRRILSHPIALYLGWISYSLYLTHLIVLQAVVRLSTSRLAHWEQIVLIPIAAVPVAHLFRMTFEGWGQTLAREAAWALTGRKETAAPGLGPN